MKLGLAILFLLVSQAGLASAGLAEEDDNLGRALAMLPGGRVQIFKRSGSVRVAIRGQATGPEQRLPITHISHVITIGDSTVIAGSVAGQGAEPEESALALRLNRQGQVEAQWRIYPGATTSLIWEDDHLFAISGTQLHELLPDGQTRLVRAVPGGSQILRLTPTQTILCRRGVEAESGGYRSTCWMEGGSGWNVQASWDSAPLLCGDWLIERGASGLVVRSNQSGQISGYRSVPGSARIACGRVGELLLAERKLIEFSLPELKPRRNRILPAKAVSLAYLAGEAACLLSRDRVVWMHLNQ